MRFRRRSRSIPFIALCIATFVACTATVPGTTPSHENRGPTRPGEKTSAIKWHPCQKSYECGELEVPLDWFNKSGDTIGLALIRKRATGRDPIGSLLLNPGGPGESGMGFLTDLVDSGNIPKTLLDHFDLVSWDPRGAGDSSGVACLTDAELLEPEPLPYPASPEARRKIAKSQS